MRILHMNTDGWIEHEGISRVVVAIAGRLSAHEHHLAAQCPTGAVFEDLHSIPVHPSRVPFTRHMRNVLDAARPDIVHLHGGGWAPVLSFARALRSIPTVVSVYSYLEIPGTRGTPLQAFREAQGASIPAFRTAAISVTRGTVARHALRSGRVTALVSPDIRVLDTARRSGRVIHAPGAASLSTYRARFCDQEPTIVFAGRGETGRGVDDVVAAHRLVRSVIPGAKLRLLLLPGSATDRWTGLDHDGVHVSSDPISDIAKEFAKCQIGVVPFRVPMTITPPLVAAEAMSVGLPVVATNLPSLAALVNADNGATVDPRRPDQIAAAIIAILTDRSKWERLSAGALRTIATDWNWDRSAEGADRAYALVSGATTFGPSEPLITLPLPTDVAPNHGQPIELDPIELDPIELDPIELDPIEVRASHRTTTNESISASSHETTLVSP